jgi:hypothetical protein
MMRMDMDMDMEGKKKLRIDERTGEIILLQKRRRGRERERHGVGVSKSGYRALDVKIGMVVMWFCIIFISAIVFFPPISTSGRVLRYLCSAGTGRERGREGGEGGEGMVRGKISLTEWPSLRQLQGRETKVRQDSASAASFLPTATVADATSTGSSISTATPTGPLRVFQVAPPVQGPGGSIIQSDGSDNSTALSSSSGDLCQVTLMVHVFKDSFGAPFVGRSASWHPELEKLIIEGNYTPPSCIGSANAVVMNFSVASQGTQFDRLGIM